MPLKERRSEARVKQCQLTTLKQAQETAYALSTVLMTRGTSTQEAISSRRRRYTNSIYVCMYIHWRYSSLRDVMWKVRSTIPTDTELGSRGILQHNMQWTVKSATRRWLEYGPDNTSGTSDDSRNFAPPFSTRDPAIRQRGPLSGAYPCVHTVI